MNLHRRLKALEQKVQPASKECLWRVICEDHTTGEQSITEYTYTPTDKNAPAVTTIHMYISDNLTEDEWNLKVASTK